MTGSEGCDEGFSGALCMVCDTGFFFQSQSATCTACNDSGVSVLALTLILVAFAFVLFLIVKSCGKVVLSHLAKQTGLSFLSKYSRSKSMSIRERKKNFLRSEETSRKYQNKLKAVITLFQILSALPSTISISFPSVYYQLTFVFNLVNIGGLFNDLGLSCSVEGLDYVSAVMAVTILPIVAALFLILVQRLHVHFTLHQYSEPFREAAKTYQRIEVLKSTYVYIFLFGTYLILPGVSTILFGMLRPCVDMDPEDTQSVSHLYLEADYSIECTSARYDFGVAWAAVFVLVYPIGIPCMYWSVLHSARPLIKGRAQSNIHTLNEEGLREMEQDVLTLSSLRFLYQEYQPKVGGVPTRHAMMPLFSARFFNYVIYKMCV